MSEPGEGRGVRALLRPSERRAVRATAALLNQALFDALDACDDLLMMGAPTSALDEGVRMTTDAERVALGHARTALLSAFHAMKVGAPDLTGLVPEEAMGGEGSS